MEGQSAYEAWLSQGNYGSEEDFIESLKVKGDQGPPGPKGDQGFLGKETGVETDIGRIMGHAIGGAVKAEVDTVRSLLTGIDGKDGLDGTNGIDGRDGIDGINGKDGKNGLDGKNGINGLSIKGDSGIDGKDGKDGIDGKDGKSAYQSWLDNGNKGNESDFVNDTARKAAVLTHNGGVIIGPNRSSSIQGLIKAGTNVTLTGTGQPKTPYIISSTGGGGTGTVTTTGTPTTGALTKFSSSTSITNAVAGTDYQTPITNPVTGTGTATQVAFWNSTTALTSSANLYFDTTNNALGVGGMPGSFVAGYPYIIKATASGNGFVGIEAAGSAYISMKAIAGAESALYWYTGGNSTNNRQIRVDNTSDALRFQLLNDAATSVIRDLMILNTAGNAAFNDIQVNGNEVVTGTINVMQDATINGLTVGLAGGQQTTNIAFGYQALLSNTSGTSNLAIGSQAMTNTTTGSSNIAIGRQALLNNINGGFHVAIGAGALYTTNGTNFNTAIGGQSLFSCTTGGTNTAIGLNAGLAITTPNGNTFIGTGAAASVTTGSNNIFIGASGTNYSPSSGLTTGSNNTIIGSNITGLSATLTNTIILADGSGNQRITFDSSGNVNVPALGGATNRVVLADTSGNLNTGVHLYYDTSAEQLSIGSAPIIAGVVGGAPNTGGLSMNGSLSFANYNFYSAPSDQTLYISRPSSHDMLFVEGGSTTQMTLKSGGNFGIGTNSPSEKLEVSGNIALTDPGVGQPRDIKLTNNNGGIRIYATNSLSGTPDGAAIQFFGNNATGQNGNFYVDSGAYNGAGLIFRTAGTGGTITERMRVTYDGFINLHGFTAGNLATDSSGNIVSKTIAGSNTWTDVTSTSATMAVNNGYTANNAGLVTLTLPSTAAYGSIIEICGSGAGGWKIAQNSGQIIHFGAVNSTSGTSGSVASTLRYDTVKLLCTIANTDFVVLGSVGNLTVV